MPDPAGLNAPEVEPPGGDQLRRIAVISMHTSPTASLGKRAGGGLNVYVREVCLSLSRLGIGTDIFTRQTGNDAPRIEGLDERSRVIHLPGGNSELDKYSMAQEVEPFAERVHEFAAATGTRYDLLYSHYWLSGAAACTLRSRLRVPWAHTAHTLGQVKNRQLARGARPEPELRIMLEKEIARAANLLVASTESERTDLVELHGANPSRVEVIAPGVDLSSFQPLPKREAAARVGLNGQRVLLFVGRLERLKGVDIILRAFARLTEAHPDLRVVVLGEDSRDAEESERARLVGIATQLGILDRVDFRGSVSHGELPAYYSAAEACVMPSYSESFGLVGLEAQACGCPVVASNVAGLASVVRDGVTGFLVDGDDPADYADRMARLLDQPGAAAQMGRRGNILAQRFTWPRMASRLARAFGEVVAESSYPRLQISAWQE